MPNHRVIIGSIAFALLVLLGVAACGGSSDEGTSVASTDPTAPATSEVIEAAEITPAPAPDPTTVPADFAVRGSVNQLHVLEAEPGAQLELVAANGTALPGTVDQLGSLLWRDIAAGEYVVRGTGEEPLPQSEPATVTTPADVPAPDLYSDQSLDDGFGYLTTRDGTTLSTNVWLPGPVEDGPYPTLVEYSGYSPSNPADGTFAQLYNALGYAYVGVNIRGTGCSGGSFEFFEPVQLTDGYDMVEAVAAQAWVEDNEAGMVAGSY
ncbi:MAG: CocE/NonD family hydrolase, partial [Acidimicrobiales bacterium]